jgi:hypothetical protein
MGSPVTILVGDGGDEIHANTAKHNGVASKHLIALKNAPPSKSIIF